MTDKERWPQFKRVAKKAANAAVSAFSGFVVASTPASGQLTEPPPIEESHPQPDVEVAGITVEPPTIVDTDPPILMRDPSREALAYFEPFLAATVGGIFNSNILNHPFYKESSSTEEGIAQYSFISYHPSMDTLVITKNDDGQETVVAKRVVPVDPNTLRHPLVEYYIQAFGKHELQLMGHKEIGRMEKILVFDTISKKIVIAVSPAGEVDEMWVIIPSYLPTLLSRIHQEYLSIPTGP